jgi:hypothetical protein
VIDQLEEASETGRQVVHASLMSVRKTTITSTIVAGSQDPATPSKSIDIRGEADLNEQDGDAEEDHSWGHDSPEDEEELDNHKPLDKEGAQKVRIISNAPLHAVRVRGIFYSSSFRVRDKVLLESCKTNCLAELWSSGVQRKLVINKVLVSGRDSM